MDLLYKRDKTEDDVASLVHQHRNLVYHCLAEAKQIDNHDAESAAFEALWDSVNLFDVYATTAFSTFACTVIRNRIYTVLRDNKKRRQTEILTDNYLQFTNASCDIDTEEHSVEMDKHYTNLCLAIDMYICGQTDKIKAILTYWRNSNYTATTIEIAQHCGVSSSYVSRVWVTFRVVVQGILKKLKQGDV